MKKTKLLVIMILVSTLSTGCSVEYNLNINNNTINEEIVVNDYITSKRNKETILKHYNKWYPTYINYIKSGESIPLPNFNNKYDGIDYHDKTIKELNNGYKYTYKYIYKINEYYDAYSLATAFSDTTVQQNSNTLILKTSKETFLCNYDYFDSLKVNIAINPEQYELNYTNAESINNNTYSWTINRKNCNSSQIILTLNEKTNIINATTNNKKQKNIDYIMYIFCGIMLIIVLIIYFIIKKYKTKMEDFDIDD